MTPKFLRAIFFDPYEIESISNVSNELIIEIGILVQPLALLTRPHILIDYEGSIPTLSNMLVNHCRKPRQIHAKIFTFFLPPMGGAAFWLGNLFWSFNFLALITKSDKLITKVRD